MSHSHSHEHDHGNYFVEQLCTIGICGALGGIAIMLAFRPNVLGLMLAPNFHPYVLAGGIALVCLVLIRALAVWVAAGKRPASHAHDHAHEDCHEHDHCHDHTHEHEHEHAHAVTVPPSGSSPTSGITEHHHHHSPAVGHDHEPHQHDHNHGHDHGHDHGFAPWRYVVLLLPVVLYFLNLPNEGFAHIANQKMNVDVSLEGVSVEDRGVVDVGFKELERASDTAEQRAFYEGKSVSLTGQYVPGSNEHSFGLVRFRMQCCAADAVPLSAVIMLDPSSEMKLPQNLQNKWVHVTGKILFLERKDRPGNFATVLLLPKEKPLDTSLTVLEKAPDNPFLY